MNNHVSIASINNQINDYNNKITSCIKFLDNMLKVDRLTSLNKLLTDALICCENVKVGPNGLEAERINSLNNKIKQCIDEINNVTSLLNSRISLFRSNIESLQAKKRYLLSLKKDSNDMDGDSDEPRTTYD